jgi:hypothetical protein
VYTHVLYLHAAATYWPTLAALGTYCTSVARNKGFAGGIGKDAYRYKHVQVACQASRSPPKGPNGFFFSDADYLPTNL